VRGIGSFLNAPVLSALQNTSSYQMKTKESYSCDLGHYSISSLCLFSRNRNSSHFCTPDMILLVKSHEHVRNGL
jgi:hypothetical protein